MKSIFDNVWLRAQDAEYQDMPQIQPIETGIDDIKAYSDGENITAITPCNMSKYWQDLGQLSDRASIWIEQQLNMAFPKYKFEVCHDEIHAWMIVPTFSQGFGANSFAHKGNLWSNPWGNPWGNH